MKARMAQIAHFRRTLGQSGGGEQMDKLGSRAHAQLLKDAAQVMVYRARTNEQLRGRGAICRSLTYYARNL
jgi:hypothetical protein